MMNKNIWIIAITRTKLIAARVNIKTSNVTSSIIKDRSEGELSELFSALAKELKIESCRLLLSDDLVNFVSVAVSEKLKGGDRSEFVLSQLQANYGYLSDDELWGSIDAKQEADEVVAFLPAKKLYKQLSKTVERLKINIEGIEPELLAATRHPNPIIGLAIRSDEQENEIEEIEIENDYEFEQETDIGPMAVTKKLPGPLVLVSGVVLLIAILGGLIYYFHSKTTESRTSLLSGDSQLADVNEVIPEPTAAPEPDSVAGLVVLPAPLSDYNVTVLNGSGVVGEAGYVADILFAEGFEQVSTGNAEEQDHTSTTVYLKKSLPKEVSDLLSELLGEEYDLEFDQGFIDQDGQVDIRIVVGAKSS